MQCLRRWVELEQSRRTGEAALGRGRPYEEPGWVLLAATIATKVARCPAATHGALGVRMPAVELVARASLAHDELRATWEAARLAAMRAGVRIGRADAARRERELRRYGALVRRVQESASYRRGVAYLAREFAWCARLDPAFRSWVFSIDE